MHVPENNIPNFIDKDKSGRGSLKYLKKIKITHSP